MISVVMPLYNAESFVEEAILSVQNQTYDDWELIIVDDGSTDSSFEIAQKYKSNKINVISQLNSGACVARNKAINLAKGAYIKFLDSDDYLENDCLENQIIHFEKLNKSQIPFGDYKFVDSEGKIKYQYNFNLNSELCDNQLLFFIKHWEVLISSPLHRKEMLLSIGGFDESLARGQESDLHFRLALSGVEFIYFPDLTFYYRSHHSLTRISNTGKNLDTTRNENTLNRFKKYEKLIIEALGELPFEVKKLFFSFYFRAARNRFHTLDKKDGKAYFQKAQSYGISNKFFTIYKLIGSIIGYSFIEKLIRLKRRSQKEQVGTSKYI